MLERILRVLSLNYYMYELCLYIYPSILSYIYFPYLFIHLSILLPMHSCIHPFIHPSFHISIHPFIYLSIYPSIHPSIHPFIHLSIHPSINLYNYMYTSICNQSIYLFINLLSIHYHTCMHLSVLNYLFLRRLISVLIKHKEVKTN